MHFTRATTSSVTSRISKSRTRSVTSLTRTASSSFSALWSYWPCCRSRSRQWRAATSKVCSRSTNSRKGPPSEPTRPRWWLREYIDSSSTWASHCSASGFSSKAASYTDIFLETVLILSTSWTTLANHCPNTWTISTLSSSPTMSLKSSMFWASIGQGAISARTCFIT